ncbi:MAG: hypothetical protein LBJ37_08890 [Paucimonas sp.]|jgi:RHS repeat-associated protein|nr:hypothetical protein [Paucimonas sp.]
MNVKLSALALFGLVLLAGQSSAASTTTYTYDAAGLLTSVDGPRRDVADITKYEYDAAGNNTSVTNAEGNRTLYSDFNEFGLPGKVTDVNGVYTTLTYTEEGWLATSNTRGKITQHEYNASGDLTKTSYPDGSWTQYLYDQARRSIGEDNSSGIKIRYTLDSMGNRVRTHRLHVANNNSSARTTISKVDELGRVIAEIDATGKATLYTYDLVGNLTSSVTPLGSKTQFSYDALGRRITTTDALGGVTRYTYNTADQLTAVVDPRGAQTTYSYDYNGNIIKTVSPDTGTSTRQYDEASNLIKSVDARGVVTDYAYDNLNRLVAKKFPATPAENITFTYGKGTPYDKGRLARVNGNYGYNSYQYTAEGKIIVEAVSAVGQSSIYGQQYFYNANNQLVSAQNSQQKITYERDTAANITAIRADINGTVQYLAKDITYKKAGLVTSMLLGNGMQVTNDYDQHLRQARQQTGKNSASSVINSNGNVVTSITSFAGSTTYQYDALDRLIEEKSGNIVKTYQWDAVGNRTQRLTKDATTGAVLSSQTLTYAPNSNVLASIDGRAVPRDAAGNTLQHRGRRLAYDSAGRLSEVYNAANSKIAEYKYNHLGQRVITRDLDNGQLYRTTVYEYGGQGELAGLMVNDASGKKLFQSAWVWFDGKPLAQINYYPDATGALKNHQIVYLLTDHLNTPRLAIGDNGASMWRWISDAFGVGDPDIIIGLDSQRRSATVPLRLPGQIDDLDSKLNYNYFRDYDADTGRYLQSDPIGLNGGLNTFAYANGNPGSISDPLGLCGPATPLCIWALANAPAINAAGIAAAEIGAGVSLGATFGGRVAGEAAYDVYMAANAGKLTYAGISTRLDIRIGEHLANGRNFDEFIKITTQQLTRDQARAVEQVLINRNPHFENIINSISPNRSWYNEAISWGEKYLQCTR